MLYSIFQSPVHWEADRVDPSIVEVPSHMLPPEHQVDMAPAPRLRRGPPGPAGEHTVERLHLALRHQHRGGGDQREGYGLPCGSQDLRYPWIQ